MINVTKKAILLYMHLIQISIGAFVAIALVYSQFEYLTNNLNDIYALDRAIKAKGAVMLLSVLLVYSLCQFWLIYKVNIKIYQIILYPIFYFLFGLVGESSRLGYIKDWAPATPEEALNANLMSFGLFLLICIGAAWVTFKKTSR